jgi:uncharacterized membrane protein
LTVAFSTDPAAGIGGESTSARLRLTNSTANRFSGPVTVSLYASTDATVSSDDAVVTTLTLPKLTLRGSASRTVKLKATLPDNLPDGSYVFIASADAAATGTAPAEAATVGAVAIESPKVDLATTFAGTNPIALSAGRGTTTSVTIRNTGNVLASGTLGLTLYRSADATLDDADAVLTSLPSRKIRLRPGRSVTVRVHLPAPGGADAGTGYVLASASPSTNPPDDDASNNVAAAPVA